MSHPIITNLPVREAIADALHRATIGYDTNDVKIFESAYTKDAVFEMQGLSKSEGIENIKKVLSYIGPLDTTHYNMNFRIDLKSEDADTASFTAYGLNQHYRPGEGAKPDTQGFLSGNMYWIDVVKDKDDGLWKIKNWIMKIVWCDGDVSIVTPPQQS